MKEKILILSRDKLVEKLIRIFLGIIAVFLITIIFKWNKLPPQLPLFYSLPRGLEQLTFPYGIFIPFLFSIIFFFLNFFLAARIFENRKTAAYLLVISGTVVSFLFLIACLKIIFLVT